ncbi:hypothetical protein EGW08_023550 [Elysia chlorotica]|uniref:VWFA domain-containing protein n=1 Tax=Elysia chlorotica TaxID=188477 RepID=A0A3S1AQ04_ELYCH|nr:hypothetical protein EGW08_023550 [Elysia chlorotica]
MPILTFELPATPECREKQMDIFFLLDSSTSIYINDYREQHQFVRNVINRLQIDEAYTRVGILTFSDDYTRPTLGLSRSRSQAELLSSVSELNLPYRTGVTNTHLAIRNVRQDPEFRQGVTKVMVVVTDGGSRQQGSTAREAQQARDEGFYVFVVGVGQYRDENEWRAMASTPTDRFIFNVTEFRQLSYVAGQLPARACPLPPILLDMCDAQQSADVIFLAGPANNDRAYEIIERFDQRIRGNGRRYLTYTTFLDICPNARDRMRPDELEVFCDRLNEQGAVSQEAIQDLLQNVETATDNNLRALYPSNQVVVAFMDEAVYNLQGSPLLNGLTALNGRSGIEVVFVGMDLPDFIFRNVQSRFNAVNAVNFDSRPLERQEPALRQLTDFSCAGINRRFSGINIDPN